MKKNIFSFTSAAVLLLAAGLAGCSREDVNDEKETRTMLLKVAPAVTRATTTQLGANTPAAFAAPGWVCFVSSGGTIVKTLEINGTSYSVGGGNELSVTTTQLETGPGVAIENVPASASRVYVFGTLTAATFPAITPGTTNISECLEAAVAVTGLFNSGDVSEVPSYGSGPIVATAVQGEYTALVPVAPAAARLELVKLTGDADIESFTVVGVYVNNYYDVLGLNGTVLGSGVSTLEDWGTDPDCYSSTGSGDERYTGTPGLLFDELSGGGQASVSNVVDFGAGNVLAYNLLSRNTTGYFPHLVVKLKDVVLAGGDDSTYGGEWFLTVTGVAKATAPTQNLDFEAGKVYRIVDLGFGPGDLSYPEPTDKQVTVTVEVQDWEIVDVIPTF